MRAMLFSNPYREKNPLLATTSQALASDWLIIQTLLGVSNPNPNREPVEFEFQPEDKARIEHLCTRYNCSFEVC